MTILFGGLFWGDISSDHASFAIGLVSTALSLITYTLSCPHLACFRMKTLKVLDPDAVVAFFSILMPKEALHCDSAGI